MQDDHLQDFLCPENGDLRNGCKIITIKIPKICCGKKIVISKGSSSYGEDHFIDGHCVTHLGYYPKIWKYFVEDKIQYKPPYLIVNGHSCLRCKEFNPYAISNQSDGTFICYSCRVSY